MFAEHQALSCLRCVQVPLGIMAMDLLGPGLPLSHRRRGCLQQAQESANTPAFSPRFF